MKDMESTDDLKKKFLKKEFFLLSWSATVQHSKTYKKNIPKARRTELITKTRLYIDKYIVKHYASGTKADELRHVNRIQALKCKVHE